MVESEDIDFLVLGSGISGLSFAARARELGSVIVVTKKEIMESNTNLAQGGIASVLGRYDSFQSHLDDTVKAGCGLSDRKAVEVLVMNGPKSIQWLISKGAEFDMENGSLSLSREGGHSADRIVHSGDYTGKEIEASLVSTIRGMDIDVRENHYALDLLTHEGSCCGVRILNIDEGVIINYLSKATILATGGIGQIYSNTSNPEIATGDGIAMALRAGVKVTDVEFVQFHPTTLNIPDEPNFLISEAVRGEGGVLRNVMGKSFMKRYDELADLATRDVVSRSVFKELSEGQVFLDIRHRGKGFIIRRFPTIYKTCLKRGYDISEQVVPIVPAAHYMCGGVMVDLHGESSLKGLFVVGESACTGVHGANRLASNSLLESVVFSASAVKKASNYLEKKSPRNDFKIEPDTAILSEGQIVSEQRRELQDIMWEHVSIIRNKSGLADALRGLDRLRSEVISLYEGTVNSTLVEFLNMVTVAKAITRAALIRKESRETHYRYDYQNRDDDDWFTHIVFEGEEVKIEEL